MRVVSLVPSVTETLLAWGVEPVACTRFCEQPVLRHVGGTKDPDIAAIVALRPDLVVVDREENRREDADALIAAGLTLHVTHVCAVEDVAPMCAALGAAVGVPSALSAPAVAGAVSSGPRRTAFVPIWRRPWMSINAATYGASVLSWLGVDLVTATAEVNYPTVELDDMVAAHPDLVLLPTEPYPFAARHLDELVAAFAHSQVALIDGQDLFWWGARTPAAVERLAQSLATLR
jgi:ABC-type Fe3+-hydroxamate transport system substrate-binding protein